MSGGLLRVKTDIKYAGLSLAGVLHRVVQEITVLLPVPDPISSKVTH